MQKFLITCQNCYLRLIKIRLQYDTQLINEGWEFKWRPFRKPLKIPMFEGGGDIGKEDIKVSN